MAATSYYNAKTGTGWRKIQTGPNKGKYQAYKNFNPTNRIKSNLTLGSGVAKFISKNVKKVQSDIAANTKARKQLMIGEGSEDNPEFITNRRGTKIKNPNFILPNRQDLSIQNTASTGSSVDAAAIEEAKNATTLAKPITTNNSEISPKLAGQFGVELNPDLQYLQRTQDQNTVGPDSTPSETPPIQKRDELVINKAENNVFTIDPATGKPVGVITRNQRKELQKRLDAAKKLKNQNTSSVFNPTVV